MDKGIALFHVSQYAEALIIFDSVLEKDPELVACVYYKGLVLEQLGKPAEARPL